MFSFSLGTEVRYLVRWKFLSCVYKIFLPAYNYSAKIIKIHQDFPEL